MSHDRVLIPFGDVLGGYICSVGNCFVSWCCWLTAVFIFLFRSCGRVRSLLVVLYRGELFHGKHRERKACRECSHTCTSIFWLRSHTSPSCKFSSNPSQRECGCRRCMSPPISITTWFLLHSPSKFQTATSPAFLK